MQPATNNFPLQSCWPGINVPRTHLHKLRGANLPTIPPETKIITTTPGDPYILRSSIARFQQGIARGHRIDPFASSWPLPIHAFIILFLSTGISRLHLEPAFNKVTSLLNRFPYNPAIFQSNSSIPVDRNILVWLNYGLIDAHAWITSLTISFAAQRPGAPITQLFIIK